MALTFGFYDSLNHDRLYNAQQMSAIFDGIINDGVFASVGSHFSVVPGTGMHVLVKSGRAWFNSTWTLNDSDIDLTIDAADTLLGRIDTVVLEVNSEQATRANSIKVVKGTAASSPVKPTLTNTATVHQHPLAHVTVAKNTTAITASMIEIVVGKTDCPFVTAILQTTDITNLFAKWENDFQTWFSTVRSTLDGDVALNLQNQIDANWRKTLRETTPPKIGLASTATPADMFDVLADVGDLNVWKKTVQTSRGVDSYFEKGTIINGAETPIIYLGQGDNAYAYVQFASVEPTVNSAGAIAFTETSRQWVYISSVTGSGAFYFSDQGGSNTFLSTNVPGKYVYFFATSTQYNSSSGIELETWYYIPTDATITYTTTAVVSKNFGLIISKLQKVIGHPAVPAGVTVTYPVSTNSNAYQEGNNSKPAGYVLENVVTDGYLASISDTGYQMSIYYADSVTVLDNGTVTLPSEMETYNTAQYNSASAASIQTKIAGKFVQVGYGGPGAYHKNEVLYVPNDSTVTLKVDYTGSTYDYPYAYTYALSKYQPVTGYPAIGGEIIDYEEVRTAATETRIVVKEDRTTGTTSGTITFEVADSITFDDSGNPTLVSPTDLALYYIMQSGNYVLTGTSGTYVGKYIKYKSASVSTLASFFPGDNAIGYIASDEYAESTAMTDTTYKLTTTITSGAYIVSSTPSIYGESMEYLGLLGDKSKVQVLSYVGTGTYGLNNPTAITASFPIQALVFLVMKTVSASTKSPYYSVSANVNRMVTKHLTSTSWSSADNLVISPSNNVDPYAKMSEDWKTIYIYGGAAVYQWNEKDAVYYFLAIG